MTTATSGESHNSLRRVNTSPARELVPKEEADHAPNTGVSPAARPRAPSRWQVAVALYHWTTCLFILGLVFSLFLGLFWNTTETLVVVNYGHHPSATAGVAPIAGSNDAPYTDRLVACVLEGRFYKPVVLNELLDSASASSADTDAQGYRVVRRDELKGLSEDAYTVYSDTCSLISTTLDAILNTCDDELGYNVTRDALRIIVDGDSSQGVQVLADTLPILVMPFWDNAPVGRYAVPGVDGSACMFRLQGKYLNPETADVVPLMLAVERSVREAKTAEWLDVPTGEWRHGWLHVGDAADTAYYSDIISTEPDSPDGLTARVFDTLSHSEIDCVASPTACLDAPVEQTWGDKFSNEEQYIAMDSFTIASAQHEGFFLYHGVLRRTVRSIYDWETLIANVSLGALLIRWAVSLLALHSGFFQGRSEWQCGGLGCVAGSRSFNLLPIMLLPRLKVTLAAFWTAGCVFEGDQSGFSEAWFTLYPALAEFTLVYYSVLNIATKVGRRRITDALFAPTLALLCLLHCCRSALAASGLLPGVDGRVTTVVNSAEVTKLQLVDYFISDVGLRMNANLVPLIVLKILLLVVNLLPLVFAKYIPPVKQPDTALRGVERAIAIRASNVGGLGRSEVYIFQDDGTGLVNKSVGPKLERPKLALNSYELVRLGYVVYGGRFLLAFDSWDIIIATFPIHRIHHLWNYRVVLFPLRDKDGYAAVSEKPLMCRLDDVRLNDISVWSIAAQPVRC